MTDFNARAGDDIHWRSHTLTVDLPYQTEQGHAFSASDRWSIPGNTTQYLEFRIPEGMVVRIYSRLTGVENDLFNIDLCSATSFTAGATELTHTNMTLGGPMPASRIWRGASNVVGLEVKEHSMLPSGKGPQASGAFQNNDAYRKLFHTAVPSLLRVENTGAGANLFDIIVIWTELEF